MSSAGAGENAAAVQPEETSSMRSTRTLPSARRSAFSSTAASVPDGTSATPHSSPVTSPPAHGTPHSGRSRRSFSLTAGS